MKVVLALWKRNFKNFLRNRAQLILLIIIPLFFVYILNRVFKIEGIEDFVNPVSYMMAGIVIVQVFETAFRMASSTIDDIVSGYMKEILVSPIKRIQVALGQILSAGTIATLQGIFILIIGFFFGVQYTSVLTPFYVIAFMTLIGFVFAGFGLFIATLIKNTQTFQIATMAVDLPFSFLCGAYLPLSLLPYEVKIIAYFNPMTYATAGFRSVLLETWSADPQVLVNAQLAFNIGSFTVTPIFSLLIVAAFGALFLLLSTLVFTRVDFSRMNRTKGADIFA